MSMKIAAGNAAVSPRRARQSLGLPIAWWVALGTTLGVCFGFSSFVSTIFGQFVRPISSEFGWTRTQTTGALTVATLLTIVGAPAAGLCIDRFGPRRVLLVASLLLPPAIACLSLADGGLRRYYLTLAAIAVVGAGTLPGTYTALVLKWFDRRRGLALGFPIAGVGLGKIILPPIIRLLVTDYGWRIALIAVAAAMFVAVVPLALFLFRRSPETWDIDGGSNGPVQADAAARIEMPAEGNWKKTLLTRQYLQLAVAFMLLGVATLGILVNFQAMLEDGGIAALTVAWLLSLEGLFVLAFRLGSGWLLDRFAPHRVAPIMIAAPAIGIVMIAFSPTVPIIAMAIPLIAIGFGGEFNVMSFFASRYFGRASYGKMYGLIFAAYTLGASLGPPLLAHAYDRTGSYRYGLLFLAALIVVAAFMIATLPRLPSKAESGQYA